MRHLAVILAMWVLSGAIGVWGQEAVTAFNVDVIGPRPATAQFHRFE